MQDHGYLLVKKCVNFAAHRFQMCVCIHPTGVWEGEALNRAQPVEGVHGRVMGEFLLSFWGGVSRRAAEPRTSPSLLPHSAPR